MAADDEEEAHEKEQGRAAAGHGGFGHRCRGHEEGQYGVSSSCPLCFGYMDAGEGEVRKREGAIVWHALAGEGGRHYAGR